MRTFLLAILLTLLSGFARGADAPLVLGVFPYISRGQLMEFHSPLKLYLEAQLHRPVELVTAPDFVEFAARTQRGEFDVVLTAPHLGRLAEIRDGYQRIVMTTHEVQGLFLVRKDSGIQNIADLKGRSIMMAQPVSIIYQMALSHLRENGLTPGQNITVVSSRTHNNALAAPLRGEADASLATKALWAGAEREFGTQLVIIGATPAVPGHMVMANRIISREQLQQIQRALLDFKNTEAGKAYLETTGQKGFVKIDDKVMRRLDPYTKILTTPNPPTQ